MTPSELATLLVESPARERLGLIDANPSVPMVEIAESLQQLCYEVWTNDPQRVTDIAATLEMLSLRSESEEVAAYAEWTAAIEALVSGDHDLTIRWIDLSEERFDRLGKDHLAAKTQTSKIYALALLGRYDEAVKCGEAALEIFLKHGDFYSAGKIEHNIGNLFWRRDLYRESEPYLHSAHRRFEAIGDHRQLAMVENCQAFVKTLQNDFRAAEVIYQSALERTKLHDLTVTEAEIETGLSNLYLFEGRYDLALRYMELSRQKYEELEMPTQIALCELEIADIYMELSLLQEASEFYRQAEERFGKLGMQAELARSCLNHARVHLGQGNLGAAKTSLVRAEELYTAEGNLVGAATARLVHAQMLMETGDLEIAQTLVMSARSSLRSTGNQRAELFAGWLLGEIMRLDGRGDEALAVLKETLDSASEVSVQVEYLCRVSIGRISGIESEFVEAIELVENSRSALAPEDLRTSYFSKRLEPYDQLVRLKLERGQLREALEWHERSRSRTLADNLRKKDFRPDTNEKLDEIRIELNWLYNRIDRSRISSIEERKQVEKLKSHLIQREREFAEISRRTSLNGAGEIHRQWKFDLEGLCGQLVDTTVIEYASIEGRISAFVISEKGLTAFSNIASEREVEGEITKFLFQMKTGRMFDQLTDQNRSIASERLNVHSSRLFDLLVRPLLGSIKHERLVIVPSGMMNYLPFAALHDGERYMAEQYSLSNAPSLTIFSHCNNLPLGNPDRALFAGVPDGQTPMVEHEILELAGLFPDATTLIGPAVTLENLKKCVAEQGIIHIACHGKFRQDNPAFSSLALFSEVLSVNNIYGLNLKNSIITLSACESGLNEVIRGEELIGMTRAFFAAGASALLMTLWRIDDSATAKIMKEIYSRFRNGIGMAASLREAQLSFIENGIHPYFWSPFILSGKL